MKGILMVRHKINKISNKIYNYEFTRVKLIKSLKSIILSILVIYIIFFIIFSLLEKGITVVSLLIPAIPASLVFLITIIYIMSNLVSSPIRIEVFNNHFSCDFKYKNSFYINTTEILYVKNHTSHTKSKGVYYNKKYTIFNMDGEKYTINCDLYAGSDLYYIESYLMEITKSYNEKKIKYFKKNIDNFSKKYVESEYIFYNPMYKFALIFCIIPFLLSIFLFIKGIFLFGLLFLGIFFAITLSPAKMILNMKSRKVILKSIFNIKVQSIVSSDIKKLLFKNKFFVSGEAVYKNSKSKCKSFKINGYKKDEIVSIIEILHIIFENKVEFCLDSKEPIF